MEQPVRIELDIPNLDKRSTMDILVFVEGIRRDMKKIDRYADDVMVYVSKRFEGLPQKDIDDMLSRAKTIVDNQEEELRKHLEEMRAKGGSDGRR